MRVWLKTFGCRANQYDSEAVRAMVESAGGTVVASPDEADVAVFNSCAVTSQAEADLRQSVRRAARRRPALRSVVMGCAAALDRGAIRALPTVEHVVAGADLPAVARALGIPEPLAALTPVRQTGTRALLRIQDGCDEHCTFCATTLARGANRSRHPDAIVAEAERLAEHHPEIVVTGVHIGTYGRDMGTTLGALVERLARDVPAARYRLTSIEATEVDARLACLLRDGSGVVTPHLHAPLQSGSDRILRRMGRHWYDAAGYSAAIARIVDAGPSRSAPFALGADVIAGFPGETEDDHRRTLALIDALPFTYLHVFPYSPRAGTAAPRLAEQVPPGKITLRAAELRARGSEREMAYARRRAGHTADVVVIGDGSRREGLTEDYLTVFLADPSLPRGSRFPGRLEPDGTVPGALIATALSRIVE